MENTLSEQSRAEQSRAEQSRAEQSRAEQSRAEQSRAEQSRFDAIISLGCNCTVAASLSKYGFRDHSGPFDWYTSDFEGVLKTLDEDFGHFLEKDNLQVQSDDRKTFNDNKYGFNFNHDIVDDFEDEYEEVRNKYARRINRYMSLAVKPVCYIRAIRNDDEIVYISNNVDFIKRVIQKYNEKSKIIFVAPKNINIPANFPFKIYQLSIYGYIGNLRSGLREIFDGSPEIIRYFSAHYDSGKRKKNIAVDQLQEENHYKTLTKREIEENALKEIHRVQEESFDFIRLLKSARRMPDVRVRNTMFVAICDFSKINMPEAIDIYGASWIGKFFYDKVSQLTRIDCFIDRRPPDRNPQYNGTPIISIDEYSNPNRNLIVVVPTYDYYEIVNNIREQLGDRDVPCVRIDEFLKNGIPYEKRRELGL